VALSDIVLNDLVLMGSNKGEAGLFDTAAFA
jgi:hypothetical protein